MSFSVTYNGKRLLILGLFCLFHVFAKASPLQDPACAQLIAPVDGASDVSVIANISFDPVPAAVNYFVDLGTTPNGNDILNNFSTAGPANFTPPQGMPELTLVYITIRAFFSDGSSQGCASQSFTTEDVTVAPSSCTQLRSPFDGEQDVTIDTDLFWDYAPLATGYSINMGTTPNGVDVLNAVAVGNVLSYDIPFDLDPNTVYFVTIVPFNENGQLAGCTETTFRTELIAIFPPDCSQLIAPEDGVDEVALTPILVWQAVPNADGYIIRVGSSPGGNDVLDSTDIGNQTSTAILDFDPGTTYYARITPYNGAGQATNCVETSFTTTFGCGPYIDDLTGVLIDLNPVITGIAQSYQRCKGDPPLVLSYGQPAFSVIWYKMAEFEEVVYATDTTISIEEEGIYRLEVTTEEQIEAGTILCTSSVSFEVTVSEAPVIENLTFMNQGLSASVTVTVSGDGDYEYAHSSINGPYQSSPVLNQVPIDNIDIYVRDRNGCGIANQSIRPDPGFPKYFTPNNDGINDFWQVRGVVVDGETVTEIEIYDRFGKRIAVINPLEQGWDGTLSGRRMLDQGFWYKASTASSRVFVGFFALRL